MSKTKQNKKQKDIDEEVVDTSHPNVVKFLELFFSYVNSFGLLSYEYSIYMAPETDDFLAAVQCDRINMQTTLNINKGWIKDVDEDGMKRVALHESLEVLLSVMSCELDKHVSQDKVNEITHTVIQTIMNFLRVKQAL